MQSKPRRCAENNFITLLNFIADPAVIADEKGRFLVVNDAFMDLTGLKEKELIGTAFFDLSVLSAETKKVLMKNFAKRMNGMHIEPYEFSFKNRTGQTRYAEVKAKKFDYAGHPADLVVFHDITRRKANAKRLKEYSEKMEALVEEKAREIIAGKEKIEKIFDSSPDAIAVTDLSGLLIEVNEAAVKLYGCSSKDDLIGKNTFDLIAQKERQKLALLIETILKDGAVNNAEYVFLTEDGRESPVEISASFLKDSDYTPVGFVAVFKDITERKQLEKSLRTSEEMFRAISTSAMDAIILLDDMGKVTYWNPAAERTFGYTNEEAVGKRLDKLIIPPQYQGLHSKASIKSFETGNTHRKSIEFNALRKNGKKVSIDLSVAVLKIKDKKHLLGIIRDVSERKEMETTLREAEKRYHALFDEAPLGIVLIDPDTATIVEFNEKAHDQLGCTRKEFTNRVVSDFEVIETPEEIKAHIKKILQEGKDEFESKHRTKNGEIIDVINTAQLIDLSGKKLVQVISRDVTEQKKTEQELKLEKEKLESVTENIGAGLAIISKDYRILWVNKFMRQINGACEGKKCYSTFHKLTDVCPNCGVKKVFENSVPLDIHEYSDQDDKGNRFWIEIVVTPIKDEKGNVISALELAVDITEKKLLQKKLEKYSKQLEKLVKARTEALKQTQAKLVKSERLATIGELAAMVGHDLRNPLTGIMGAAYYLKNKHSTELGVKGKEMLETIENAIIYSNKIVNDLLEYSRDLKLEIAETTPKELLQNALSLIEVPKAIRVVDSTENKPTVKADAEKMRRVFINIIRNAFDAMPDGGTLTIESREVKGKLKISFQDTGTGMSKETLSKLKGGVPLFTTKAKGMGFGLPICKRIAEAHGGKLSVESKVGKGTTITITVPVKPKPPDKSEGKWIFNESMLQTITAKQKAK